MDEHSYAGKKPQIAVVNRNTLAANGLTSLIEGVMPMAEVAVFNNMSDIPESLLSGFFHFFISADVLFENREYFVGQCHKTIVVTIPACFRTLDATLNSHALLREFLRMEQMAHGGGRKLPEEMKQSGNMTAKSPELTPREIEVLHEIVTGHINKEIADKLNISLTTVITHRKNIMEKLHAKSVATLAIYAVMHGIVPVDQI